jgi:drug/metabolite transporter (DMT)-like permease
VTSADTRFSPASAPRWLVLAAFAAVYVLWGSTYLAIRYAIETIPPFLMAGGRFLIAGGVLYVWARWRGAARPERVHWRSAFIVGTLLLVLSNGAVTWAEQTVPSGITSLIVCTVPLWMVMLEWAFFGGGRPSPGVLAGVVLGLAGVIWLIGPGEITGADRVDPAGAAALLAAPIAWGFGSLWSRQAILPKEPLLAIGMEMVAGGALLLLLGLATGELPHLHIAQISARSYLGLFYLVIFGALIGFTAYLWLLRVATAASVSTHSFVNPVIAVLLGWAIAGEAVTGRTLLASAVIVAAVALITLSRRSAA